MTAVADSRSRLPVGSSARRILGSVAIARALAMGPEVILADEPTGNLDRATGQEVMAVLEQAHHSGAILVLVTHDAEIGARAHRRLRMVDGAVVSDERS